MSTASKTINTSAKLRPKLHEFSSRIARQEFLENDQQVSLTSISKAFADDDRLEKVHCENLIGAVSIPVGVAGELFIKTEDFSKKYMVPLATTEGALIASVARGMKVISQSGGAFVDAYRVGTTRAPVFECGSLQEATQFTNWLENQDKNLKEISETGSNHLKFLGKTIKKVGSRVFVRFRFATGDAMGMNMVTIGTQKMVDFIETAFPKAKCTALSGNFCVDKKPSWQNTINGRGFEAWAEVVIPQAILQEILGIDAVDFYKTWVDKCMIGSAISGSLGFNAHAANVVAAFFAATGQDLAQVVEGSQTMTLMDLSANGGVKISVYMPAVMVATVGGGTKLSTQQEALQLMNVSSSQELALILAASVLAGEISLLASITKGTLANSHARLGR